MPAVLTPPPPVRVDTGVDERAARAALRAQIARLEEQLAGHVTSAFPHSPTPPRLGGSDGARLQTFAEVGRTHQPDDRTMAVASRAVNDCARHLQPPLSVRSKKLRTDDRGLSST